MATRRRKRRTARRVTRKRRNYWSNNASGHARAAKKGWRRRKKASSSRKRRKTTRKRRNPRAASYMPARRNPRKRKSYRRGTARRRSYRRRNPRRRMTLIPSQRTMRQAVKVGVGVASGFTATPVAARLMQMGNLGAYDNFLGLVHILLGSVMIGASRNRDIKDVGMMIAGFGVYDLVASNVKALGLSPLPRYQELTAMLPGMTPPAEEAASASYGVAMRPTSAVSRGGVAASYQGVGASFEAPGTSTVGLACDMEAMGHLPGVDFDGV